MAQLTVIWWRDIPAQVIAKAGRANAKRELPQRFQDAIDRAAMRGGARETDAYLAEWRRASSARPRRPAAAAAASRSAGSSACAR